MYNVSIDAVCDHRKLTVSYQPNVLSRIAAAAGEGSVSGDADRSTRFYRTHLMSDPR